MTDKEKRAILFDAKAKNLFSLKFSIFLFMRLHGSVKPTLSLTQSEILSVLATLIFTPAYIRE